MQRWQQIAESAAKQAGRGYIPRIREVMSFEEALELAGELDVRLIPYELAKAMDHTRSVIGKIRPGNPSGSLSARKADLKKRKWKEPDRQAPFLLPWERGSFVQRRRGWRCFRS